ncbi:hypothetical protein P170DRAFT_58472 [Aspergillus steynii IBT 23096]|uniref:Zn(2)-C6 fungal-type domain-containing protein n=1 Tax=Aspergillus steynii IBT 23096 TaxID=1392250 RepID=A0A2I2FSM3_9EURO|nr:uncharacterized protein P170DRAFT_58472 [Aspergillus steynii IBT 23096]PLB43622.1 hypothetical protein P170DRAFT_58472 [Aspergillus steynii IBT 23096]
MDHDQPSPAATPSASVACVNCREKHLKCDGNVSGCTRCRTLNLYCYFVPSRRGRKCRPGPMPGDSLRTESLGAAGDVSPCDLDAVTERREPPGMDSNHLVGLYYLHFHQAHPFLPPHEVFLQSSPPAYLVNLVEYVGWHYLVNPVPDRTTSLRAAVQEADLSIVKVQALLLLSIILHTRLHPTEAKECLAQAIQCSLELGLHYRGFSDALETHSPVGAESARRTWWEIFIVDTLLAAVQVEGSLQFTLETPDVPLPCAQEDYTGAFSGGGLVSISDMDRQALLHDDAEFSSPAYRVEAAVILRRCLLVGTTHAPQESVDVLDATITSWFHRVQSPCGNRPLLRHTGETDQMIFQATTIMHCASIYLHFPKSSLLAFLPITGRIFCAGPPAFSSIALNPQIHTAKVLAAATGLSKLASLSSSVVGHTPFFVCTLILSAIIQLAVLSIEVPHTTSAVRPYLGLNIGTLKAMRSLWAIAAVSMERIRNVTKEVEDVLAGGCLPQLTDDDAAWLDCMT